MITEFNGEYSFLSNFYPASVEYDGETYPSVEHAYQAAKTLDLDKRASIRAMSTPGKAKRLGKRVTLRDDWDKIRLETMLVLVRLKFQHPDLRRKLLATGMEEIVEGNYWGDTFWGQCPLGNGFNHLGKILMRVREELNYEHPSQPK